MNDLTVGVKLTADGKQLVGEVKSSSDSLDGLGAAAQRAQTQAEKLNNTITAMAKQIRMDTAGVRATETAQYSASLWEKQDLARYREREIAASRASVAAIRSETVAINTLGQETARLNRGGVTVKTMDVRAINAVRDALSGANAESNKAVGNTMLLERAQALLNGQLSRGQISTGQHAAALAKLNAEYGGAAKNSAKMTADNARNTTSLWDVAKAAGAVAVAYKTWSLIKTSAMDAARYEELGVVMKVVGNNAGYTSTQMQQAATETQHMGITMLESRNTVVRLAQAHINLADSSKLARLAQDAAVIGMTNSSDALQRMIYGIQSGQTDVLKTIGINVNFEQSYAKLAQQLRKNTNDLSEHEKMQARKNAVLEQGATIAGAYEAAMGTAGKQIRSSTRYIEDLKVIIGETFNESLTVGVMAFTSSLKGANGEVSALAKDQSLKQWGESVTDTMAFAADAVASASVPFRLVGNAIGVVAAQSATMMRGDFAALKAIKQAGDERDAAILKSASMFRDAADARRAAQASDAEKAKQIESDYLGNVAAILKAHVNESREVKRGYLKQLSATYYPEFARLEKQSVQAAMEAEKEKNKLGDEALKKRDALVKAQDDAARRQLLGEKEYAISVIKDKYAEEIELMQGLPDAERRINELRKQMDAEVTDIQINGIRSVASAAEKASSMRASSAVAGANAEIGAANAVAAAWTRANNTKFSIPASARVNANNTVTMNAGTPIEFQSSWDANGKYIGSLGTSSSTPGYATGGSFIVPGAGGTDTTPVKFMATPGERVTIQTPEQQRARSGSIVIQNINLPGISDARQFVEQLKQMLRTDPNLLTVGSRAG